MANLTHEIIGSYTKDKCNGAWLHALTIWEAILK